MSETPQVNQLRIFSCKNLVLCLLVALIAIFYLYHINILPQPDNDESVLLNVPYRFVNFGDAQNPAGFHDAFNNDVIRKYPPLVNGWLRNVLHWMIGFSPLKSRIISSFMILTIVIVGGGIIASWLFKNQWLALLPFIVLGLNPNVVMGARSIRFEQEIAFLGMLGVLGIPFLVRFIKLRRLRIALMFLGGIMVGWAANSHPWGVVFLLVLVFTFIFYADAWKEQDGVGLKTRLIAWGCGILLPCLVTLFAIIIDWPNYTAYVSAVSKIYDVKERVVAGVAKVPGLSQYCPAWLAAHIPSIDQYIIHYQAVYPNYKIYRILFKIEVLLLIWFAIYSLSIRTKHINILVILATWLAVGFVIMFFGYPPSSNYFLYPAMTISLGFSFMTLYLWENYLAGRPLSKVLRYGSLIILVSTAMTDGIFFLVQTKQIRDYSKTGKLISLDTRFQAVKTMAEMLGMDKQEKTVLCDFNTWVGGGYNHGSLFATGMLLLTPIPKNLGGIIFELPVYDKLMFHYGKIFGITMEQSLNRFKEMLAPLQLAGVIFERNSTKNYRFYSDKNKKADLVNIGIIMGERKYQWRSLAPDADGLPLQVFDKKLSGWRNLSEGFYVLELYKSDVVGYTVRVCAPKNQKLLYDIKIPSSLLYRFIKRLILIEVPKEGAEIELYAGEGVPDATLLTLSQNSIKK